MKEQLDLVKILKDCPEGMELDCTMYDNVTLKSVSLDINNNYPICIETKHGFNTKLTKYGQNICINDAKCVIFPKGKTTWKEFQRPFIDGDIVINKNNIGTWIGIYHKDDRLNETFSSYCYIRRDGIFCANSDNNHGYYETRLATKEEKEKFFQAIKNNGYKWNVETKTLEKLITLKFKDEDKIHLWTIQDAKEGDVLAINWYEGYDYWEKIVIFKKYHNEGANSPCVEGYGNTFKNRKLAFNDGVPYFSKTWTSCLEPATKEQRDFLFQTIKEAGYKWNDTTKTLEKLIVPKFKIGDKIRLKENHNYIYTITDIREKENKYECGVTFVLRFSEQNNWELIPNKFDPKTLKPFDKVLVRDIGYSTRWHIQFFETMYEDKKKYLFVCLGGKIHSYCIPYVGNEHLLNTINEPSEFYRYWEN